MSFSNTLASRSPLCFFIIFVEGDIVFITDCVFKELREDGTSEENICFAF